MFSGVKLSLFSVLLLKERRSRGEKPVVPLGPGVIGGRGQDFLSIHLGANLIIVEGPRLFHYKL